MNLFQFKIDDEIEHIWFFEKNGKFLKKHYIYVTKEGKVVVKGVPMIKNDSSKIGYKIFKKYMIEQVRNGSITFKQDKISKWVKDEIDNDLNSIGRTFRVKSVDSYKKESQLQAQIAKKYGPGRHKLIVNNKYGVGLNKKYCTIEEFNKQGLTFDNIVLDKFWSEMDIFFNGEKRTKGQKTLDAWCE